MEAGNLHLTSHEWYTSLAFCFPYKPIRHVLIVPKTQRVRSCLIFGTMKMFRIPIAGLTLWPLQLSLQPIKGSLEVAVLCILELSNND